MFRFMQSKVPTSYQDNTYILLVASYISSHVQAVKAFSFMRDWYLRASYHVMSAPIFRQSELSAWWRANTYFLLVTSCINLHIPCTQNSLFDLGFVLTGCSLHHILASNFMQVWSRVSTYILLVASYFSVFVSVLRTLWISEANTYALLVVR